jgi:hypothetical protein
MRYTPERPGDDNFWRALADPLSRDFNDPEWQRNPLWRSVLEELARRTDESWDGVVEVFVSAIRELVKATNRKEEYLPGLAVTGGTLARFVESDVYEWLDRIAARQPGTGERISSVIKRAVEASPKPLRPTPGEQAAVAVAPETLKFIDESIVNLTIAGQTELANAITNHRRAGDWDLAKKLCENPKVRQMTGL